MKWRATPDVLVVAENEQDDAAHASARSALDDAPPRWRIEGFFFVGHLRYFTIAQV
jgi:hypothetical protein